MRRTQRIRASIRLSAIIVVNLCFIAFSAAGQSLNVSTYGADSTGATDSWKAFQSALDDAACLGRGFGASGAAGASILTISPAQSWQSFASTDVGHNITIECDLGLPLASYPLKIDQVLAADQVTLKTAQNVAIVFAQDFSNVMVIWRRAGIVGRLITVPSGSYKANQSLQMLSEGVGLVGEVQGNYNANVGASLTFPFTTGIIQRSFLSADSRWFPFGASLVSGATTSYHLTATEPGVCWDYQDSMHVERSLNGLTAFTVEFFLKPNATPRGAILSLMGTLPDKGQEFGLELSTNSVGQLFFRANIGGTLRTVVAPTPLVVSQTYHVAAQFDGATLTLFLDGVGQGSVAGLSGQSLLTKPYQQFLLGGWRGAWPGGGTIFNAFDCYVSHIKVSKVVRYAMAGFTAPTTALTGDNNTLLLDEGAPSQQSLFLVDVGGASIGYGFTRVKINRHLLDSSGFMGQQRLTGLKIFSYGTCVYVRRTIGTIWKDLFLQTYSTAILGGPDTFSNQFSSLGIAGGRGGLILSGPGGICSYQDVTITGGKIGAWLSAGGGVISNWYLHGSSTYQLILQNWEGQINGLYFSNEDLSDPVFEANLLVGGSNSDVTITGSKFETYRYARPSIIVGNVRSLTLISGMLEPHADATESIKFIGTPTSKVVLVNPNHGRLTGQAAIDAKPWSVSAPAVKLVVTP